MATRRRPTPGIRERSPGHFELRAYNAATGKQVTRTYVDARYEQGVGIRAAQRELAKLVAEISEGKHGPGRRAHALLLARRVDRARRVPGTVAEYVARIPRPKLGGSRPTRSPISRSSGSRPATSTPSTASCWPRACRPRTVMHYHRILRASLRPSRALGMDHSQSRATVTPVTAPRPEMHVPTVGQARASCCEQPRRHRRPRADLLFGMLTGMRRGELCGVQWSDVDWAGQRVRAPVDLAGAVDVGRERPEDPSDSDDRAR